ncbi:MAG: site-specific integrase [Chloroflexota bacterium]
MNKEEYPDSLKKLLSEFTVYIKDVRRGAESTIEAYNHDLDTYFEYLQSIGIDLSKPEFSEQLNWGYVTYLRNRKNADSTIQRRFDGQHAFWYFLHKI